MPDIFIYLIKANIALAVLAILYLTILRKLTFYMVNRCYLVFAILFSALYPLIDLGHWLQDSPVVSQQVVVMVPDWYRLSDAATGPVYEAWVVLFWLPVVVLLILFLFRLGSIAHIHRHSRSSVWQIFRYRKVNRPMMPFSFLKNIYINAAQHSDGDLLKIFRHESVHVRQWHSLDNLLAELTIVFYWFNPFAWYMRRAIYLNLEYIADHHTLKSGVDRQSYQFSLLNASTYPHTNAVNHFNFKDLKNRIIMMNRKKTSPVKLSIYFLILPVVVVCTIVFGFTHPENLQNTSKRIVSHMESTAINELLSRPLVPTQDSTEKKHRSVRIENPLRLKSASGEDPLYVIQGKAVEASELEKINPNRIERVTVIKDSTAVQQYGKRAKNGAVVIRLKSESNTKQQAPTPDPAVRSDSTAQKGLHIRLKNMAGSNESKADPLFLIDGKDASYIEMKAMDPKDIESIVVLKEKAATEQYGSKGKNGVILITTKAGAPKEEKAASF